MSSSNHPEHTAFGKGVYGATDALRLINFHRGDVPSSKRVSRSTIGRWVRGYSYDVNGASHHHEPLWRSDYATGNEQDFEISFRDLIELRFVKAFRDLGLSLQTIRDCFARAVDVVDDPRPFSTQKFRTDGQTIFLEVMRGVKEGEFIDLNVNQGVFKSVVAPSLKDLEFDAGAVSRWYPLGVQRSSIVIDPNRSFGRPLVGSRGIPTEVLATAVMVEKSAKKVARLYDVSVSTVSEAASFEAKLAA